MNKYAFIALVVLVPVVALAQVIFPNRGGTGNSTAPAANQLLIGNGSTYDLKTLTAGSNVTIDTSGSTVTVSAALEGGGVATTDIDTEAELEAILTDVSNLYTNNDGSLYTEEQIEDFVGGMLGGTETLISVTYQDATNDIDFVVNDDLSLFDNTTSAFITSADDTVSGSELDGVFSTTGLLRRTGANTYSTITDNSSNWDTAFGWGDHSGQGYLTTVTATDMAAADFGDFTCNGTVCTLDTSYLTGNETITLSGDVSGSGATAITVTVTADAIEESMLKVVDTPSDEECLTYEVTTGDFEWQGCASGALSTSDIDTEAELEAILTDVSNLFTNNDTIDISDNTNLVGGTGITLTGDTLSADLGTSISGAEIETDTITHADIADADQATTKCIYFEDPTADDDFQSVWANKTSNDFLITEIWAESDQTVAFMFQVDDGTPSDVDTVDLSPAAGEAEDTSLNGDTTIAAGEELDLVVTSVTNSPTWVSMCFTGNWID